ncbi:RDD family protein [Nocardiopsis ganjiahuensis]|uniref:RDD family protein n=1 Tax=Nocardiopsis ganjiahuensis TaxID=239984 RepID=UPI00034D112E|nr:RDD family protein [Nocardiopsis ganjiahuensis]
MSSPYWNPQHPHQGGRPPQAGGWPYGGPPPGGPVPPVLGGQGGQGVQGPEQPLAGFGVRLAARLIDYVLAFLAAGAFFFVMIVVVVILTGSEEFTDAESELWAYLFFFGWGVLLFFYDWLYLIAWGRTIGKMLVGIKVVNAADGGKLTQGQVIGRSAFFCLPQSVPCLGHLFSAIESMVVLGDDRGRALHDRVARTRVIRTRT